MIIISNRIRCDIATGHQRTKPKQFERVEYSTRGGKSPKLMTKETVFKLTT
jgi:hypothetical protein